MTKKADDLASRSVTLNDLALLCESNSLRSAMKKMDEEINSLNKEFEIIKQKLNEI